MRVTVTGQLHVKPCSVPILLAFRPSDRNIKLHYAGISFSSWFNVLESACRCTVCTIDVLQMN